MQIHTRRIISTLKASSSSPLFLPFFPSSSILGKGQEDIRKMQKEGIPQGDTLLARVVLWMADLFHLMLGLAGWYALRHFTVAEGFGGTVFAGRR